MPFPPAQLKHCAEMNSIVVSPVQAVGDNENCHYVIPTQTCRLSTVGLCKVSHRTVPTTVAATPPSTKVTYRCRRRSTSEKDCYVYSQATATEPSEFVPGINATSQGTVVSAQRRSSSSTGEKPVEESSAKVGVGEIISGSLNTDYKVFYVQSPEPLPDILRTLFVIN